MCNQRGTRDQWIQAAVHQEMRAHPCRQDFGNGGAAIRHRTAGVSRHCKLAAGSVDRQGLISRLRWLASTSGVARAIERWAARSRIRIFAVVQRRAVAHRDHCQGAPTSKGCLVDASDAPSQCGSKFAVVGAAHGCWGHIGFEGRFLSSPWFRIARPLSATVTSATSKEKQLFFARCYAADPGVAC